MRAGIGGGSPGKEEWVDELWAPTAMHSVLLVIMIALILTGRRGGTHESRRRQRHEREGLRAALLAELAMLRGVYRLNAGLIAAGSPSLISGRAYFSIYRGNMQRLVHLTPPEIAAVVTAFSASEMLDAAAAAGNRMRSRHPEGLLWQSRRFDVKRLHRAARASAEEAVAAIEEAARDVQPVPASGWRGWGASLSWKARALWRRLSWRQSRGAAALGASGAAQ